MEGKKENMRKGRKKNSSSTRVIIPSHDIKYQLHITFSAYRNTIVLFINAKRYELSNSIPQPLQLIQSLSRRSKTQLSSHAIPIHSIHDTLWYSQTKLT